MKFLKIICQKDTVENQHCTYFAYNVNLWQYLPKLEVYLKGSESHLVVPDSAQPHGL